MIKSEEYYIVLESRDNLIEAMKKAKEALEDGKIVTAYTAIILALRKVCE